MNQMVHHNNQRRSVRNHMASQDKKFFQSIQNDVNSNKKKLGEVTKFIFEEDTCLLEQPSPHTTKKVEFLNEKIKANSFMQFLFAVLSILVGFIQYELENNNLQSDENDHAILCAEWVCFGLTIGLLMTIFFNYILEVENDFYLEKLPKRIWYFSTNKLSSLAGNFIVFIWHPSPFVYKRKINFYSDKFKIDHFVPVNSILFSLMLLRFWFIFKVLVDFSIYSSARSKRVCRMNNFKVNFFFCIKAQMQSIPYQVYGILLILCIIFCSVTLRIYERGLDEVTGKSFSNIFNCIWLVIITMTTVGFGDFFPSSSIGRLIGVTGSFMGVFLISMLVVTITNVLMLSTHEYNAYLIMEKMHIEMEYLETSKNLLAKYWKLVKMYKKEKLQKSNIDKSKLRQKKFEYLYQYYLFQQVSIKIQSTFPPYSVYDAINENINNLEEQFDVIKKKEIELSNTVSGIVEIFNKDNNKQEVKE